MALNRGYAYRSQVGPAAAGQRLIDWLGTSYRHSSPAQWAARLAGAELTLDDTPASGEERLRAGQVVIWQRPPWDEPDVPLTFEVVHEDADLVAVSKPSGLPTMPAGGFLEHTLFTLVRAQYGDVHPVHRLGRGTSGLVLFARSVRAAAALARAWRTHAVTKVYRTLVSGDPSWTSLDITTAIGPVPHAVLGTVHAATADGRAAHSAATVVERRGAESLCDVRITTGRPHQIRIHLAAVGHPLAGDPLYVTGGLPRRGTRVLPGDTGYLLHARAVQLAHPEHGRPVEFVAPLPETLQTAAERSG